MTPILINLPDWVRERLRQIAEEEGIGLSEMIEKWTVELTKAKALGYGDERK